MRENSLQYLKYIMNSLLVSETGEIFEIIQNVGVGKIRSNIVLKSSTIL